MRTNGQSDCAACAAKRTRFSLFGWGVESHLVRGGLQLSRLMKTAVSNSLSCQCPNGSNIDVPHCSTRASLFALTSSKHRFNVPVWTHPWRMDGGHLQSVSQLGANTPCDCERCAFKEARTPHHVSASWTLHERFPCGDAH
ncbi:hypothetical protein PAXRUDRAFT_197832 [Paxillus rubicundulus Ve08.2h10]|uniref:Uncharacterized protein n=1 Tax=Paxillus rubicundulus Ve08.2h10 TaxID=930991 RepID=A0A0D0DB33_9AGAM|nr:hypothetical protein PAXRUDRAFT_197832 [Paxillus rubicundulus Ve08.2h10]